MKNYFKKFSIMFVMSLVLVLGCCVSSFAATDDGLAGNANLNNTAENSAKVGDILTAPEKGWKRYDDSNSKIVYDGNWTTVNAETNKYFNKTHKYNFKSSSNLNGTKGDKITFMFYGSKIRIISTIDTNRCSKVKITIDNVDYYYITNGSINWYKLLYQNLNLDKKIHTVTIEQIEDKGFFGLDAIDIDDTGYLLSPAITLDKSTMNLTEGDSGQLTATTTPSAVGVTWKSSDESVATVDPATGEVTGNSAGTCTITAKTADGLTATCTVTVTSKGNDPQPQPTNPTTGDANLYIELVDGQIKQYFVSQDEINKFTNWYESRDKDHSEKAAYQFSKGSYKDYVVHDQIDWFEVR